MMGLAILALLLLAGCASEDRVAALESRVLKLETSSRASIEWHQNGDTLWTGKFVIIDTTRRSDAP